MKGKNGKSVVLGLVELLFLLWLGTLGAKECNGNP
jgi:hypothetical protein